MPGDPPSYDDNGNRIPEPGTNPVQPPTAGGGGEGGLPPKPNFEPGPGQQWVPKYTPPRKQLVTVPVRDKFGNVVDSRVEVHEIPGEPYWVLDDIPKGSGGGSPYPTGSVRPIDVYEAEFKRQYQEQQNAFNAEQAALDRLSRENEGRMTRELQKYIADQQAELDRKRQELDGWRAQMEANINLRGQNIGAANANAQNIVNLRGQDVTQRGQNLDFEGNLINQAGLNTRWAGDYALAGTRLGMEGELGRRTDARSTSELFGYANPGQYDLLQSVMAPTVAPPAPDFSPIYRMGDTARRANPQVAPPTQLYPDDPTGGLGDKLNLPPYKGTGPGPVIRPPAGATA